MNEDHTRNLAEVKGESYRRRLMGIPLKKQMKVRVAVFCEFFCESLLDRSPLALDSSRAVAVDF